MKRRNKANLAGTISQRYQQDMAARKNIKVDLKPIIVLLILALLQFYFCYSKSKDYDKIQYTYFGILFFTSILALVPDALSDRNMGKFGSIFLIGVISVFILGLYSINPANEVLYVIIVSYANLMYHLLFASKKQIERNISRGGCMMLCIVFALVIAVVVSINSNMITNFSKAYNLYYFCNGIYFLTEAWIEYNTQKQV